MARHNQPIRRASRPKNLALPLRVEQLEDRAVPAVVFRIGDQTIPEPAVAQGVEGTLNPGSATDAYHFQGLAGDRLTFDWLMGTAGHWQLFAPMPVGGSHGEASLFSLNFGTDTTVTLPVAGAYTLIVAGTNAAAGATTPYSFRVLDTAEPFAPTAGTGGFALNAVTSGTLTASGVNQEKTFTFTAAAGRVLYLDNQTANSGSVRTTITAPDGTAVVNNHLGVSDSGTFVAPRSGTYTLRQRNDSGAARAFRFNLLDLDGAGATAYTPGTTATVTLPDNRAEQFFRLPGTAGERIVYDGLNANNNQYGYMHLYGPGGSPTGYGTTAYGDAAPYTETETGSYYLRIDGQGSGTQYAFRTLSLPAAPTLSFAATTSGTLTPADSGQNLYRFTASAGERLVFDALTPASGGPNYYVYGPNNQGLGNFVNSVFTAPQTGEYVLGVYGSGAGGLATSVAYSFRAYRSPQTATPYTLGTTVGGTIATPGQVDTYTFAGTAGQRVAFDTLETGNQLYSRVQLLSPSGQDTTGWYYSSQDYGPETLTETGTYTLRVSRDDILTAPYAFRLLDVAAAATPLPFGTATTGDLAAGLTTGRGAKLYAFDVTPAQLAAAGGAVRFSYTGTAGSGTAYLYGPNDSGLGGTSLASYFQAALTTPGTYVLMLTGALDAAPNAFAFTAAKPVTTATPYALGTTVGGTIAVFGQVDTYTFAGTAGQRVAFDALDNAPDYSNRVQLLSPSGADTAGWYYAPQDYAPETLTETGTYTLRVFRDAPPAAGAGAYRLRLLDAVAATPLDFGAPTAGDLNDGALTGRANKLYAFDVTPAQLAAAGGAVRFSYSGTAGSGTATLHGPNDVSLGQNSLASYFQASLAAPGTYVLMLHGSKPTADNAFAFTAAKPVTTATPYALGTTLSGSLTVFGQVDVSTFTGAVGQRLLIDALDNPISNHSFRLIAPSGFVVRDQNVSYDSFPFTLPEAGTYRLEIYRNDPTFAAYSFRLIDASAAPLLSAPAGGATTSLTLTPGNGTAVYRVVGTAGQRLTVSGFTASNHNGTYELYDAYNGYLGGFAFSNSSPHTFFLTQTGTYFLAVRGSAAPAVSNAISFTAAVTTPVATAVSGFDTLLTATLANSGVNNQTTTFTFTAPAGRVVYLDNRDTGNGSVRFTLSAPAGGGNPLDTYPGSSDPGPVVLPTSGMYTLTVRNDAGANVSRSVAFKLLDLDGPVPTAYTPGTTVSDTFAVSKEARVYRFTGTLGQRFYYDGTNTGTVAYPDLYGPGAVQPDGGLYGQSLLNGNNATLDSGPFQLSQAGTHYLVVSHDSGSLGYGFRLIDTAAAPAQALSFAATTTGTLDPGSQADVYRFSGTAGDAISVDWLTGSGGQYDLYGPSNNYLAAYGFYDVQNIRLPATGEYTFVIRGASSGAISYSFRAYQVPATTTAALTLGVTLSDSLSIPGQARNYTFTGAAGQRLYYDGLSAASGQTFTIQLLDPNGATVSINGNNLISDLGPITLSTAGIYTFRVVGLGNAIGAYSFRLIDTQDTVGGPAQALPFGPATSFGATYASGTESAIFTFSGTAGDRVFFDGLTGANYTALYYLYGPNNQQLGGNYSGVTFSYLFNPLPTTGTYTLVAAASFGWTATTNAFTIRATKPLVIANGPLTLGAVTSGTIAEPGERRTYTFTGSVGQVLNFDGLTSASTLSATLTNSSGEIVHLNATNLVSDSSPFRLTTAGVYTLTVGASASGAEVGAFRFRLIDRAQAPATTLSTSAITTGNLPTGREMDVYRFTGIAGQRLFTDWLSADTTYQSFYYLFGPGNQTLGQQYFGTDLNTVLPVSGEYTLQLRGNVNPSAAYGYSFRAYLATTTTTAYTLGTPASGTIANPGDYHDYALTGAAGQKLVFDGLSGTGLQVQFFAPDGGIVWLNQNAVTSDYGPYTLLQGGTFRLRVFGGSNDDNVGAYSFNLIDRAVAPALALSMTATTDLTLAANQLAVYRFTGTKGQRYFFDALGGTATGVAYLYAPNDGYLHGAGSLTQNFHGTFPSDGQYTLIVYGAATGGTFSFRASLPPTTSTALTLGGTVNATLSEAGETDEYTFAGVAGRRVFFDGQGGAAGLTAQLVSPSGVLEPYLNGVPFAQDNHSPVVLAEAGTWTLRVSANDAQTGAYRFRLLDPAATPDILPAHFFSVYVDGPDAAGSSVQFATADGTGVNPAVAGVDYQARSGTVYLNPGETAKAVRVNVLANPALRGTATYAVNLSAPANGSLGTAAATGSIVGPAQLPVGVAFVAQPVNVVAGATLSAVTVRVLDDAGNTVTGFNGPVTISLQNNPGGGTLSGTLTVNALNGVATFGNLSLDRAGTTYRLAAAADALPSATSVNFAVAAGLASKLALGQGPTNALAGVALAPAVTVLVQDQFGNTVATSSAAVTVALNGGPTLFGTLTVSALNGVAAFGNLAVQTVGAYTLTATGTNLTAVTTGSFSVTAAAASKLVFGVGPTGVSAGAAIAPAVTVLVQDQFGNAATGSGVTVAVAVATGSGAVSGTPSVAASGGVATFGNLRFVTADNYTLTATAVGLTAATTGTFTVAPATPTALAFATQPPAGGATAGAGFTVAVRVLDGLGNPVTASAAPVTLSLQANPGGGVLGGTLTVNAVNGVATFTGLSLNKAAAGYALRATSGGLTLADSATFAVNAAQAAGLTFLQGPTDMVAGSGSFPLGVSVRVVDAFLNPVTASAAPVTLVLVGPGGFPNGPFTVNAAGGVATFGGNTVIRAAGPYTLSASSPGLTNAPAAPFVVSPGSLFGMDFAQNPGAASAGAPINPTVTVTLNDFFGNRTSASGVPVTMTVLSGPGGFAAASTVTVNSVAGLASFSNLVLNGVGTYILQATTPNGVQLFTSSQSAAFAVVPTVATRVAFGVQPPNAVAGAALAPAVTVRVQDQFGNTVAGDTSAVTLSIANNAGGSTLGGTLTVNAVNGVATFADLSLNKSGGGYTLAASSNALTGGTSSGFAVTAAAPSQLAVGQQPTGVLAGAVISPAVTVRVLDAFGNLTASGGLVTLAANGLAALGGTVTVAALNGVATFADLTLATVGTYSLTASCGALTGVVTDSFQVLAAAAGSVAFGQQPPTTATAGQALSPAVTVRVLDAGGNLATGFTGPVTVTVPGGFAAGSTATVTALAGVATFGNLTLTAAGSYQLSASAGALVATSGSFSVVAGVAAGLAFSAQPTDAQAGVALGTPVRVRVVDAFGNTATVSSSLVTLALGANPGGGALGGVVTVAAVDGVATFVGLSVNRPGTGFTLAATAGGLTGAASAAFSVSANLAAAPTVLSTLLNGLADDGTLATRQRSMVTSVQVTFSGLVVLDAGAVRMTRTRDGVPVELTVSSQVVVGGNSVVTFGFAAGGATYALNAGGFALTDGVYGLAITASRVRAAGSNLWLNGDGVGGDYAHGADPAHRFWRLFGDADGNGKVDGNDTFYFRQAFGVGQAANIDLRSLFDFDGNGVLNAADSGQFKLRFGRAVK